MPPAFPAFALGQVAGKFEEFGGRFGPIFGLVQDVLLNIQTDGLSSDGMIEAVEPSSLVIPKQLHVPSLQAKVILAVNGPPQVKRKRIADARKVHP